MKQRDLELLSSYLDGQLNSSDNARLETRLSADPQLASVLNDMRATRSLLRKLPARKAPRNFTLTRKMVGQNPPLPRAYPIFRFATVLATLLFVFSFGLNSVGRQLALQAPAYGMGGGGNSEDTQPFSAAAPAAATEAPAPELSLAPTMITPEVTDTARVANTPAAKAGDEAEGSNQFQGQNEARSLQPLVPSAWQLGLAGVAIAGFLLMLIIRQLAMSRWR